MDVIENSHIIKKVLITLINISGRKTTKGYAISITDSLLKKLEKNFSFLKHVEVKDTRFLEDDVPITVMSEINSIEPTEIGKAMYAIITTMNESLGKNAGHFFIKELSRNIGDDYNSSIKNMGVDLSLMQLEHEVSELEKRIIKTEKI
jgi:hypothetical protein